MGLPGCYFLLKATDFKAKLADGNNYRWWDSQQDGKTYVGVDESLKFVSELFEKYVTIFSIHFLP